MWCRKGRRGLGAVERARVEVEGECVFSGRERGGLGRAATRGAGGLQVTGSTARVASSMELQLLARGQRAGRCTVSLRAELACRPGMAK